MYFYERNRNFFFKYKIVDVICYRFKTVQITIIYLQKFIKVLKKYRNNMELFMIIKVFKNQYKFLKKVYDLFFYS